MSQAFSTLSKLDGADDISAIARSILGKRWKHRAAGPNAYDCVGVVRHVAVSINLYTAQEAELPPYSRIPNGVDLQRVLSRYFRVIGAPAQGCIVTLQYPRTLLNHVGIITTNNTIIHSLVLAGCVIEEHWTAELQSMIRGCYAFERPLKVKAS
jgi:cell wall-associated NlpC family hydrolase